MTDIILPFTRARNAGAPIVAIKTADPYATIQALTEKVIGEKPSISWDAARGMIPMNEAGKEALKKMSMTDPSETTNIFEVLTNLIRPNTAQTKSGLPADSVVFVHAAPRLWDEIGPMQAIYNTRDPFKSDYRTLVLLGVSASLPAELTADVVVLDEPLPKDDALGDIVRETYKAAQASTEGLPELTDKDVAKAVGALSGLSIFSAEQVVAMSIRKAGIDQAGLWSMKKTQIEQTPGLSVDAGKERFSDIGGCENIKEFAKRYVNGKNPPRCIVRLDEVEKMLAGNGGDSSGTSQDQMGALLSFMQDNAIPGCLFFGPPGSAKSLVSKAIGNEIGVPTISMDMGSMKSGIIGSSEARIRQALKVISAVSSGNALFIGTLNKLNTLPPELRRRFKLGLWFYDLPTSEERDLIWKVCLKRHDITLPKGKTHGVDDVGWTGAEIDSCCEISWRLNCSLVDASSYIVPVSRSSSEEVERLRQQADGKFISASFPGVYKMERATEYASIGTTGARAIKAIQ